MNVQQKAYSIAEQHTKEFSNLNYSVTELSKKKHNYEFSVSDKKDKITAAEKRQRSTQSEV